MSKIVEEKVVYKDRIKLPFTFDGTKMLQEVQALNFDSFEYYDAMPLRAPAHLVDTSLPFPPPADDYADGTWTDWLDTDLMKKTPYIKSIVEMFSEHTTVNLVRLLRLGVGSDVKEHTDPTLGIEIERSMIRLTIPIYTNKEVTFYLNGIPVPLEVGECWYLKLTEPHRITNFGSTERINLTIDMIPNDWITKIIEEAQAG